ncbi:MAG: methyl-accepting chemotaxis protein [Thermosynechococcaceae cyanobacterium]
MLNSSPRSLQVYISSTFSDLQAEHHVAVESILTSGHQPAGVGQFVGSADQSFSLTAIEHWIDASDVYVLILGNRYGALYGDTGKSLVHLEYDYAVAQQKPLLVFLINDSAIQDRVERDGMNVVETEHFEQLDQLRQQTLPHNPHNWTEAADIQHSLVARLSELATQLENPQLEVTDTAAVPAAVPTNTEAALRVTLQTMQGFSRSIQDVAAATQGAEHITQQALTTALEGEASAQAAAAGLAQLKTTVAESARTTKQLADNAQQLSKVVTLVSQIASRANVIALNASLEVSRMGARGEEFVSVANDMRQLAQHTAKTRDAMEQIIEPLQTRTNLVMTSLAEGVQSAIATTPSADQAQAALTQLSQLSEQLSQLVRMLTKATSTQTERSNSVAEVLQGLEEGPSPSISEVSQALQSLVLSLLNISEKATREPS